MYSALTNPEFLRRLTHRCLCINNIEAYYAGETADTFTVEAKELTKLAVKALEDKKGEDIRVIDIHGVSVLADYFVIADGSNASQVKAMADNVEEELGKAGHECRQIEGYQTAGWILMDYGDLIVHIFSRDDRLFYDLERIWRDGKVVENVEEL